MIEMIAFFVIFFTIYGLVNFYFFVKLKSNFNFGWLTQLLVGVFLVLMIFSPLAIRVSEKYNYEFFAIGLSWIGYLWMAFVVLFSVFGVLADFMKLIISLLLKSFLQKYFFQKFIKSLNFLLPLTFSFLFLIYGYFEALNIQVEKVTIKSEKIARNLRVVQISDVHVGLIVREKRVKRIVEKIRETKPDIVVSTGDFVDRQIDRLNHIAEFLDEIKPVYGKFAVTGNHEFYAGLNKALYFIEKAGFKILRNEVIRIEELNLNIVGIDDLVAERYGMDSGLDLRFLLKSLKNEGFTIILRHRPLVEKDVKGLFDLQLSGHTHKGQFFPFNIFTAFYYSKDSGLIKINDISYLYISRGTGTWGPPIRIFSTPEITIIDIIKEN